MPELGLLLARRFCEPDGILTPSRFGGVHLFSARKLHLLHRLLDGDWTTRQYQPAVPGPLEAVQLATRGASGEDHFP